MPGDLTARTKQAKKNLTITALVKTDYLENVKIFHAARPFFYDRTKIFWTWNKEESCYEMCDETDLLNSLESELKLDGATITNKMKGNYLEAMRRIGREKIPVQPPKTWIQFKNKIIDAITSEEHDVSPQYFFTNPIPHNLGSCEDTPEIDKLFTDWVGDKKDILYEIIAYSCLRDYPIHVLFALIGCGRNGKSKYLAILENFVGLKNVTSTEFDDLLENRFEKAKLYKKLLCTMGETNFTTVSKTSILKKLTGQDLIGFELKNRDPFDDYNYAKIVISSNSLPSTIDTSEGFYRRWIIIEFNRTFPEGKDVLQRIPAKEYDNLCRKCIKILCVLLQRGSFSGQGTIEDRKSNYIKASNPISLFIAKHCVQGDSYFVKNKDFFLAYNSYLAQLKRRPVKKQELNLILADEGFFVERKDHIVNGNYIKTSWIDGIKLAENAENDEISAKSAKSSLFLKYVRENRGPPFTNHAENAEFDESTICQDEDLHTFDHLQSLLIDRPGQEIEVQDLISYGFTDEQIDAWKGEGKLCELRAGRVKLL